MTAIATPVRHETFRPMFIADWTCATFMHFAVEPAVLQPRVPFELDLWHGDRAIVSLVAFRQRRLRPVWGGPACGDVFRAAGGPRVSEPANLRPLWG